MAALIGSNIVISVVDKRRTGAQARANSHSTSRNIMFTANAAGTTTTIVGADATLGTSTNVVRIGDKFKLYPSNSATAIVKEETVFTVTAASSATGTTTVTFTPAAAVATATGNTARLVSLTDLLDEASLDAALGAINGSSYTATRLASMTQNDKIWAYRQEVDKEGI